MALEHNLFWLAFGLMAVIIVGFKSEKLLLTLLLGLFSIAIVKFDFVRPESVFIGGIILYIIFAGGKEQESSGGGGLGLPPGLGLGLGG